MSGRVLVTGAAGFIGSHLVERLLAEGREVLGVDCLTDYYDPARKRRNLSRSLANPAFRFVEADLVELELANLLDGCDLIFHEAAQAGVRASWGREFSVYLHCNLAATQRLLESVKGREDLTLVYASSSSVYGLTRELPMKESSLPRPYSPYGVTKLAAEQMVDLYRLNHGLKAVALRYFTVYGPRQRPDMAFTRFIGDALSSRPLRVFGDGGQTRDFTYIDDIVEANLLAAAYEGEHFVFNVGGGSRVSLAAALDLLAEKTGAELRIEHQPAQHGDVRDTLAASELIAAELGWRPRTALAEGLARQVDWFRSEAGAA